MRWRPPIEGEIVCNHIATNSVDLTLILTRHKKFYKTVLTLLGKNGHNTTLLHFLSCRKCFEKTESARHPPTNDEYKKTCIDYDFIVSTTTSSKTGGEEYKLTGIVINHSKSKKKYVHTLRGFPAYHSVRKSITTGVGFGYKFDRNAASKIWDDAQFSVYAEYYQDAWDKWEEWRRAKGGNTAKKSRVTRLAKVRLGEILDRDEHYAMNYAFNPFIDESTKSCYVCGVRIKRRDEYCRFCRLLSKTELHRLEQKEKQIQRQLSKLDRRYRRKAIRDEVEDKQVIVSEIKEEKDFGESFSNFVEVVGKKEARELMGISEYESEDEEGLSEYERNEM